MIEFTDEKLRAYTPTERANLRANALRSKMPGAAALVVQIDALGLPLSTGGLAKDDPIYIEMEQIIWSVEAKAAAIQATSQGMPALAGVDPILQRIMGARYTAKHQGTVNAGYIVGDVMLNAGYVQAGKGKMPAGSIAKTAEKWKPAKSVLRP